MSTGFLNRPFPRCKFFYWSDALLALIGYGTILSMSVLLAYWAEMGVWWPSVAWFVIALAFFAYVWRLAAHG